MNTKRNDTVFEQLGIDPVINACGIYTDLGGSMLSDDVWRAMTEANQYFTSMPHLLDKTGERIAALMDAPAARVTPGASAALALSVGACMTGLDGRKWEQLPDTAGLKNEVLLFASQLPNYKYASCLTMPGAKIKAIGGNEGLNPAAIAESVDDQSACVVVAQHLTDWYDYPPKNLKAICDAAHAVDLPVVVDAAYLNYPIELFKSFTGAGADLVCFSAKYFYGPNAGGFVVGDETLMKGVAGLDFTGYESGEFRIFGRPFKMGRYEVIAVTLALEHWMNQDHEQRWRDYARRVELIRSQLPQRADIEVQSAMFTMDERLEPDPINCLSLRFSEDSTLSPNALADALRASSPVIEAIVMPDSLVIAVDAMTDEHAEVIAARLGSILAK